ncbi:MAG: ATP-dependent metallopeptidase FtsH/Yme1/Tma family protein, partial [Candidatus Zixiibacteriota bacterium]
MNSAEDKDRFSSQNPKRPGRPSKEDPDGRDSFSWKGSAKSLAFWLVIILAFILIYSVYSSSSKDVAEISYSEFLKQLE